MKKRIISLALALVLTLALAAPAFAEEEEQTPAPEYRLVSITGKNNWTFIYDDGGWLPTEMIDNDGGRTCLEISYDDEGRIVSWDDLNARETRTYSYDSNGNLLESGSSFTYGDGGENHTVNSYDDNGNRIHSESSIVLGGETSTTSIDYTYDDNGNLIHSERSSVHGSETTDQSTDYTYDDAGHEASSTTYSSDGEVYCEITYSYDSYGNLLREEYTFASGSTIAYEYTYDDAGNKLSETYSNDGEVTQETTYAYDEEGREVSETTDRDGESSIRKYIYLPLMTIYIDEGSLYEGSSGIFLSYNFYDSEGSSILPASLWPCNAEPQLSYDDAGYLTGITVDGENIFNFTYEPVA